MALSKSNRANGRRVNKHCYQKLKFNILSFSKQNIIDVAWD